MNYQEIQLLRHDAVIKKGDRLVIDCVYDTTNRDYITFGGLSSDNEMCLGFLWYYPKSSLQTCTSSPTAGGIYRSVGVDPMLLHNIDPYEPWISQVGMEALRNVIITNRTEEDRLNLNTRILNTSITYDCKTDSGFVMSQKEVPMITEEYNTEIFCAQKFDYSIYSLIQVISAFSLTLLFSVVVSYFCFKFWRSHYFI